MSTNNEMQVMHLQKSSTPEQVKTYFQKVFELKQTGKEFPVDLDHVWPLVYQRKDYAVKDLLRNFIENDDYQAFRQKAERGAASPITYLLSVPCLEFFIAKKAKPVFEVYRQVFHKVLENGSIKSQPIPQQATYKENQVFLTRLGSGTIKGYYTNGLLYYSLSAIMAYLGYRNSSAGYYAGKFNGAMKVALEKQEIWFVNLDWIESLLKSTTCNINFDIIRVLYHDLFNINKSPESESDYTYRFTDKMMLDIMSTVNLISKPSLKAALLDKLLKGGLL